MCTSGRRINKAEYTAIELYDLCCEWAQWRFLSFPRWDKEEIENEAFVIASKLIEQYDHTRASLPKFLEIRLYEPMRRSYSRSIGMKITRTKTEDGNYGPRVFKSMFRNVENVAELQEIRNQFDQFEYPTDMPVFPPRMRELVQLLAQGKNQRQAADILGVTEGMISLRVKEMRNYLIEQHKMGYSHW